METKAQQNIRILPRRLIDWVLNTLDSWAALLVRWNFTPNSVTVLALVTGVAAGILFAVGKPLGAGLLILLCGIFDVLDGKVAKQRNQTSLFGAIFDSTLDRYSEFFLYLGLAVHFRHHWALWITFFTFLGSTMVSYTRARAEGLDIDCKVGFMQRAERMVLMALGALVGYAFNIFDPVMIAVLALIALVSNFTAWQRTFHVRKVERERKTQEQRRP